MMIPAKKIRKLSDARLLNAILYKDAYQYPFEYVEMCKEELRARGYSSSDIQQEIERARNEGFQPGLPRISRFDLVRRVKLATLVVWIAGITAPLMLIGLLAFARYLEGGAARALGIGGFAAFFIFFLAFTRRSALLTRLAQQDREREE